MRKFLSTVLLLASATSAQTMAACVAQSGADRLHLIELYTSEGCSSCPPAERWLSTLRDKPAYIGMEFHVDYWDLKDWRDPYSDARFSVRQKALSERDARGMVYTPQIRVDGNLWKDWPKGAPPEPAATTAPVLKITVDGTSALHVNVESTAAGTDDRVYVALTENSLSNAIRGGENRGKTLHHDHVVRAFAGPLALGSASADLDVPKDLDRAQAKVVAFIQNSRDGSVAQVVPLPLASCTP
jgi:hypothetical protein